LPGRTAIQELVLNSYGLTNSALWATTAAQDFLLFVLPHIEVVERAGDLRSHLVEHFRRDAEILSLSCGFTLSFGFSTILSLKRSTTWR
jgi:hypothetical protein